MTHSQTESKKEDFKIIENHLRKYKTYVTGIKNMYKQLDYNMPKITTSWEMKEEKISVFIPSSQTEKFAIDRLESNWALKLHEDIVIYDLIINSINEAVAQLEDEEQEFVQGRYFDNSNIAETAESMGYSERQIFLIRNNVKEKLLISLKNLVAIEI